MDIWGWKSGISQLWTNPPFWPALQVGGRGIWMVGKRPPLTLPRGSFDNWQLAKGQWVRKRGTTAVNYKLTCLPSHWTIGCATAGQDAPHLRFPRRTQRHKGCRRATREATDKTIQFEWLRWNIKEERLTHWSWSELGGVWNSLYYEVEMTLPLHCMLHSV